MKNSRSGTTRRIKRATVELVFSERRTLLLVFDAEECLEYRKGPASLSCFVDFMGGWEDGFERWY